MTQDDIVCIAQDAGIVVTGEAVCRLCEIVAEAELLRCINILERLHERQGPEPTHNYYLYAANVLRGEV